MHQIRLSPHSHRSFGTLTHCWGSIFVVLVVVAVCTFTYGDVAVFFFPENAYWPYLCNNWVTELKLVLQRNEICHPAQWSILFYSILFYSILFCHILLILFHLNVMFPGSQPWYYTLLDLRAIICRFWHVLRVDRGRLCGNGTRTDVPPFLLLLFPFERLPRRDDWHRAVRSANRRAPCRICIKRPHAIGLVRATANRLACHYRCLLLGGARGAR